MDSSRTWPDELAHDAHVAGAADHAFVRDEVAGNDPEQRRLAGSVGPDQRRLGPVRDLEGHAVEQLGAVGEEVIDVGNVNMSHAFNLPTAGQRPASAQPARVRNSLSSGPEVVAPRPPSSTNTATARSPCTATIQAWVLGGVSLPNSAVPVFAPTGAPGTEARNPACPLVTTARIMSASAAASAAVTGVSAAVAGAGAGRRVASPEAGRRRRAGCTGACVAAPSAPGN